MAKQTIPFTAFTEMAGPEHLEFINEIHTLMLDQQCIVEIKEAKSGYVVSYKHTPSGHTVANYVFRKKGPLMRIYATHIPSYMKILDAWPAAMKDTVKNAGPCKRLIDPNACNARCPMGFNFILDGQRQQKCRNSSFMFYLEDETKPQLKEMIEHELATKNEPGAQLY